MSQDAFDRALVASFEAVSWAGIQVAGLLAMVWAALPPDWPPPVRLVVMLIAATIALQLVGLTLRLVGLPFRVSGRLFGRALLQRRSPFGRAEWASLFSLWRAGMLRPAGLVIGRRRSFPWRPLLFRHGEGHVFTVAGPGAGKSTGLIVPTLCELRHGSVIVTDPKAQLAAMTARHRATVSKVVFINPFADELAKATGVQLPDTGYNPLSILEAGYNLKDDAENLSRLLMVTDRSDSLSYFDSESAGLLAAFMVWLVLREPVEHRTLAFLWAMVRENDAQLEQRFEWMAADSSAFLRAEGEKFLGLIGVKPQWQGVISKAQLATSRYAPESPLGDHTARGTLDLAALKREDLTVYILVPTGRAKVAAPWLNLLMGVIGLAIGKPGPARPVYLLMDEAPALGHLPDLRNHLRESREAGLRAWIFTQTRAALAAPELYGDNGFEDIMGLCETRTFFSIGENRMARDISDMLGERTAENRTSADVGRSDRENVSSVGVPLMRPEEILRLKRGRMIVVRDAMRPIRARLVPYWKRSSWAALVDRNPYRR